MSLTGSAHSKHLTALLAAISCIVKSRILAVRSLYPGMQQKGAEY
jgi:hypothetical protein